MQILSIRTKTRIRSLAFSPSGRDIAAACGDGSIRVWNRSTGDVQLLNWIAVTSGCNILYLNESQLVATGPGIWLLDVERNDSNQTCPEQFFGSRLCLSPDGTYLGVTGTTGDLPLKGFSVYATSNWSQLPPMEKSKMETGDIAISPDGKYLATGQMVVVGYSPELHFAYSDYKYAVHLREMPSGKIIQSSDYWEHKLGKIAFSPDGRILAGGDGPCLRIWDIQENRETTLDKCGVDDFQAITFTPCGRYLVTVSNDEMTRVWDTRSWQEHSTYTWQIGKLLNIAISPDGLVAAAGSDKGKIVIWDLDC